METNKIMEVVMLPSKETLIPNCLFKSVRGFIGLWLNLNFMQDNCYENECKHQHLYIVSDNEIKEGNWYIDDTNLIRQSVTSNKTYWANRKTYKKIEATTDISLFLTNDEMIEQIAEREADKENYDFESSEGNGYYDFVTGFIKGYKFEQFEVLPQIPQQFIEEYVKSNSTITHVEVKMKCGENKQCECLSNNTCLSPIIKTNLDNVIYIVPIVEKTYTIKEIRKIILDYGYTVTGKGDIERNLDKWIEENL